MSGSPLLFLYLSLKTGLQTSEEQKLIPSIKSLDVTDSLKSGWPRVRNTETKTKRGGNYKGGQIKASKGDRWDQTDCADIKGEDKEDREGKDAEEEEEICRRRARSASSQK